jgi:hypothetical protein
MDMAKTIMCCALLAGIGVGMAKPAMARDEDAPGDVLAQAAPAALPAVAAPATDSTTAATSARVRKPARPSTRTVARSR